MPDPYTLGYFMRDFLTLAQVKQEAKLGLLIYDSKESRISATEASKMRHDKAGPGTTTFCDYFQYCKKSDIARRLKQLKVESWPNSPSELCDRLKEYDIPPNVVMDIRACSDIYEALAVLFDHTIPKEKKQKGEQPTKVEGTTSLTEDNRNERTAIDNKLQFFRYVDEHASLGDHLDIAFHQGTSVLFDGLNWNYFTSWLSKGIHIRILVNIGPGATKVVEAMPQKGLGYISLEKVFDEWKKREKQYVGQIEVQATTLPLLHKVNLFSKEDCTGYARAVFYKYGEFHYGESICHFYPQNSAEFNLLSDEFEYLWNNPNGPEKTQPSLEGI